MKRALPIAFAAVTFLLLGRIWSDLKATAQQGRGGADQTPENVWCADANGDKKVDISDPVYVLGWLFLGTETPNCIAENLELDIKEMEFRNQVAGTYLIEGLVESQDHNCVSQKYVVTLTASGTSIRSYAFEEGGTEHNRIIHGAWEPLDLAQGKILITEIGDVSTAGQVVKATVEVVFDPGFDQFTWCATFGRISTADLSARATPEFSASTVGRKIPIQPPGANRTCGSLCSP